MREEEERELEKKKQKFGIERKKSNADSDGWMDRRPNNRERNAFRRYNLEFDFSKLR